MGDPRPRYGDFKDRVGASFKARSKDGDTVYSWKLIECTLLECRAKAEDAISDEWFQLIFTTEQCCHQGTYTACDSTGVFEVLLFAVPERDDRVCVTFS